MKKSRSSSAARPVRTTVTLDADVAARISDEVRRTGKGFKEVLNSVVRSGLTARQQRSPRKRFVVTPSPLGLRPGLSYDNIGELLEQVEGPHHK